MTAFDTMDHGSWGYIIYNHERLQLEAGNGNYNIISFDCVMRQDVIFR